MKIYKRLFIVLTLLIHNYASGEIISESYEYQLSEFDSPNDGRLVSEFMAVTTLLQKAAAEEFVPEKINNKLQQMLVNTYPVSHHITEQRTIKCEAHPFGVCVKTVVSVEIDSNKFNDYIHDSIDLILDNGALLLTNYHKMMSIAENSHSSSSSVYVKALVSSSEAILELKDSFANTNLPIENDNRIDATLTPDTMNNAEEAKVLATSIIKLFQKGVDSSIFKTHSEKTGEYFKLKITSNFNADMALKSLLYDQVLTNSYAVHVSNPKGCGPIFSHMYLDMKVSQKSLINSYGQQVRGDAYYYSAESKSGISTYEFPTSKNVALAVKRYPGLIMVGICDTAFNSELSQVKTEDLFPWSIDGQELVCDTEFDCTMRGALWLLNNMSVEIYVNEIRVCDLVKISDWSQKITPVLESKQPINPLGTVLNEVRVPSIYIREGECNYFAKGAPPESMDLWIKFNLPNKNMF